MDKKKVLIVDDEADLVQVIKFRLIKEGYDVSEAYDGEEGLKKAYEVDPDLILLDMQMPRVSGLEFYREVLTEEDKTKYPILVLTARGEFRDLFLDMHADGFMTKPFETDDLLNEIKLILNKYDQVARSANQAAVEMPSDRIIIAEGNEHIANNLVIELVKHGYMVSTVKTGVELVQRVYADQPDLAIVNMNLPEMTGEDAVAKLKNMPRTSHVPTIVYVDSDVSIRESIGINLCKKMGIPSEDLVQSNDVKAILEQATKFLHKMR